MSIEDTLANKQWLAQNENVLKALFPAKATNIQHLNAIRIGDALRVIGVDWDTPKEFENIMVFLEKIDFIIREGKTIRRNPVHGIISDK